MSDRTKELEPEKPLLGKRSLESCPPEFRQALTYIHRLRACWKPEGHAKLVVPTSWTAFLPCADNKCGAACVGDRNCPSHHVRIKTRLVAPIEDVPHDVVSEVFTDARVGDSLANLVCRAFEGAPRARIKKQLCPSHTHSRIQDRQTSGVSAKRRNFSQSSRHIDFTLVPEHTRGDEKHLLLGINQRHVGSELERLPEELIEHGRSHLTLLAQKVGPFPEWLVLFVLVYDACRLRIVAYVPRRRVSNEIDCTPYVVDELTFRSSDVHGCELALERVRFLLALRTLRRHVHHLAKSLFTPRDGIRHSSFHGCSACDRDALSDSLGSTRHCSSEYSTCPSTAHTRARNRECDLFSSSGSFSTSCCSTCSSVLESASSSDSVYSQESQYMEPSTLSLYQGKGTGSNGLTETRRREIIAWTQQVVPTEHPVKDNYRLVISSRQKITDTTSRSHS